MVFSESPLPIPHRPALEPLWKDIFKVRQDLNINENVPQISTPPYGDMTVETEHMVSTADVSIVILRVSVNGQIWKVSGSAKRQPGDKPDIDLGVLLATTRALQKLANQFSRQANGRVKNNDNIAAQQKYLREKASEEQQVLDSIMPPGMTNYAGEQIILAAPTTNTKTKTKRISKRVSKRRGVAIV